MKLTKHVFEEDHELFPNLTERLTTAIENGHAQIVLPFPSNSTVIYAEAWVLEHIYGF